MYVLFTLLVGLFYGQVAMAQKATKKPQAKFAAAYHSGMYLDQAKAEIPAAASELKDVKLTGQSFKFAYTIHDFELELGTRLLFPAQSFWNRRSENHFELGYYAQQLPYLGATLSYVQVHQTSERNHDDAPAAMIQRNRVIGLGLKTSLPPYMFTAAHGGLLQADLEYLTSFERKRNFGVDYTAGIGYVYAVGTTRMALVLGHTRNYFNGSVDDEVTENNVLHVRHIYTLNSLTFYSEI